MAHARQASPLLAPKLSAASKQENQQQYRDRNAQQPQEDVTHGAILAVDNFHFG
jgi:hypothetical protein